MLDQNTDRMWYVIGAVLIGAAIIFGMNTFMPETFASVGGMFEDLVGIATYDPDKEKREEIQDLIDEGYIPVATADELDSIRNATLETYGKGTEWEDEYTGGLNKKYVQVADVDLSEYSEEGWNPIGTDEESSFTGTYDGGNYVIRGLEVKGEGKDYQGLFGRTFGATISNVGLIDNKVTGTGYVGGLVGRADSSTTISNSYSTGSVEGQRGVGGLVGHTTSGTEISNSYSTGPVYGTGTGSNLGGLVGLASYSTISNSYATGSVDGTRSGRFVDGVHTGRTLAGLVGSTAYSTISNSYATGLVTGSFNKGGLVGSAHYSSATSSYWDEETTNQTRSAVVGATRMTTDEMKDQATYEGWDFETVWKIDGNDYPKLR